MQMKSVISFENFKNFQIHRYLFVGFDIISAIEFAALILHFALALTDFLKILGYWDFFISLLIS